MARVLGLSFFFHDSAAALVCDGEIIAAASEERFCRRKHTNEFPKMAIEFCLRAADLRSITELDAIVFYEKPVLKMFRVVECIAAGWPRGWASFTRQLPAKWIAHNRRWQALFGFPRRQANEPLIEQHQDLAHSGQLVVEELILELAREAKRLTGSENLVMAGGVALNGVANYKIETEGVFRNVWIQPAAGDDGGALGAALHIAQHVFHDKRCSPMKHAYLGPEYSEKSIQEFFQSRSIPHEQLSTHEVIDRTADLIAAKKVVGWFQGRMEFGPRALGARSILANAADPEMKDHVNEKIKFREYFRPFAPAVPLERVHEYFEVAPGTECPFMLKVPQVCPQKRVEIPAVTHVDGSGRVQTVTEDNNPFFYQLIQAVERRTGVPIVLNTSFNVLGEPIVCSPEDAYRCFLNTGIDALVIGHTVVTEKPSTRSDICVGEVGDDAEVATDSGGHVKVARTQPYFAAAAPQTSESVLSFYKELPFNYYSNAIDNAQQLMRANRIKAYPVLHRHLRSAGSNLRVLDVGCGSGWFINSCAHYYGSSAVGLDFNSVVLEQARSVARLLPRCEEVMFIESDIFKYQPEQPYDVVNSLGVLHSTYDCHAAIRKALTWVRPGGYFHLGLYHLYGRKPFLDHFVRLEAEGASQEQLFEEFKRLCPDITDETHMRSWYRDQVIHPHETQHSYEEIQQLLAEEGLVVESTSINRFKRMLPLEQLIKMEKECEALSRKAIEKQSRYFPGFFVVWARRSGKRTASHEES